MNYQTHDAYSSVIEGRLWYPFVDTSKITGFGSDANVLSPANKGYESVWRTWSFLYFASGSAEGKSGALLKSDKYGKLKVETADAANGNVSIQTVGRLITTDCRWPKDLSGAIQNYPGMRLLGTNTAGVPTDLYLFAYDVLKGVGAEYTKEAILHRIQEGAFGYARVQILKG